MHEGELTVGKSDDGTRVKVEVEGDFEMDPDEAREFGWAIIEYATEILDGKEFDDD